MQCPEQLRLEQFYESALRRWAQLCMPALDGGIYLVDQIRRRTVPDYVLRCERNADRFASLCKDIMQSPCESPEMSKHEEKIRCWGVWSVALELSEQQYAGCPERGKGWRVDRYELRIHEKSWQAPPHRLPARGEVERHGNAGSL
jgi:hypothetical protein